MPDALPQLPPSTSRCQAVSCTQAPTVQWRRRSSTDPGSTEAVFACGGHAISLDAAAHVHAATCTAPDPARVPACNCTPEPAPTTPAPMPATQILPTGWTVPVIKASSVVKAPPVAPAGPVLPVQS